MNKFSKTSYPRHLTQNNFLHAVHQNRQRNLANQQHKGHPNKHRFHDYDNSQPLQNLIEKKIQIDPSLLFNGKPQTRPVKTYNQTQKPTIAVNRELCATMNDGFYKKTRERPQSKQQSRIKIMQNFSLNKRKEEVVQRPQTSKGQRNVAYNRQSRKKSLEDQYDYEVQIKRQTKTAFGTRRRNTSKQLELQTSIDPEFLALFAS